MSTAFGNPRTDVSSYLTRLREIEQGGNRSGVLGSPPFTRNNIGNPRFESMSSPRETVIHIVIKNIQNFNATRRNRRTFATRFYTTRGRSNNSRQRNQIHLVALE